MSAGFGEPAVGLADGMLDEAVADVPAVEEKVLVFRCGAGQLGQADDAGESQLGVLGDEIEALFAELIGPRAQKAVFGAGGREVERFAAIVEKILNKISQLSIL